MPKYGSCASEMKQVSGDVQLQRNGRSFRIGLIDEEGMHGGAITANWSGIVSSPV